MKAFMQGQMISNVSTLKKAARLESEATVCFSATPALHKELFQPQSKLDLSSTG